MKLYHNHTSPYVRKAWATLHVTGLLDKCELVHASGTPVDPDKSIVSANPLGKVPCLVTDGGRTLFDSRVITRYLDHVAGTGLYPEGEGLFEVLKLEALADGILDASILIIYEARTRPEEMRYQPWIDGQADKVRRAIDELENSVEGALQGDRTAAQIAVACALGYLDFRFPDMDWRAQAPQLAEWYAAIAEEPFMKETEPSG